MEALVVYFSKFGNTRRVADAIAQELMHGAVVRTLSSDKLSESAFDGVNLVIMGTPTHNMNLPKTVGSVFEKLPRRILPKTPVATFDTSYKMSALLSRFTASKKLVRKLRKIGGKNVIKPETFHVIGREGPLYTGELDRAREWARTILFKLNGRNVN